MKYLLLFAIAIMPCVYGQLHKQIIEILKSERDFSGLTKGCAIAFNVSSILEEEWLLKMIDASSKIPTGLIYSLNFGELGNFEQCIGIDEPNLRMGRIRGKYCIGNIEVNLGNAQKELEMEKQRTLREKSFRIANLRRSQEQEETEEVATLKPQSPTLAICIPDTCTPEDAGFIVRNLTFNIIKVTIPKNFCQTNEDVNAKLTSEALITIGFLAVFVSIMVVSTAYDIYCWRYDKVSKYQILVAFSIFTNGSKLFTFPRNTADQLTCLNGIRFISMAWIIIGHQHSIPASGPISNLKDILDWTNSPKSMTIVSANMAVDSFFLISGTLMTYGFIKSIQFDGKKFNIFLYYFHRYLRLTPALAATVLMAGTLARYFGSGPYWPMVETSFQKPCQSDWWTSLLYIANYASIDTFCQAHGWYLDVDMQLFILSPILLILLWKCPFAGILFTVVLTACSIGISFYVAWIYEMPALITNFNSQNNMEYMNNYYLLTHARAGPWLIGVLLGYYIVIAKLKNLNIKTSTKIKILVWIVCISSIIACMYGGHGSLRGTEYNKWGNALYIALVRPVWSICIAWIVFACIFDMGGIINWILSLPIYQVLNRFTYSMYLLHVNILFILTYSSKAPLYFTEFNAAYSFWGTYMLTFGVSILWVLAFESPTVIIEKMIFGRR